jgi:hypothetical protein
MNAVRACMALRGSGQVQPYNLESYSFLELTGLLMA